MLHMEDIQLDVRAIVKVGKTLGGSQLMNIAHLPAVRRPFVLGIPQQFACVLFAPEYKSELTTSLSSRASDFASKSWKRPN